jgi:alpha-L-arabinofuranosidase
VKARVKVDLDRRIGAIDPMIYGNFAEHLGRCIYGGIYEPGSPLSDERGFRKDVKAAVRDLRIPILRWPGGNFVSGYHWQDGIGPRETRPARPELAWHDVEPNKFGTDDFIEYSREIGAAPYICVNMGTGTLDEAMNWVEYCNGTQDTYFAGLRRKYGHAEPYDVKYWGLGNELYGPWQIGHKDAVDHAKAALEFAKVMKWNDPSIKLVTCGAQNVEWDWEALNRTCQYADYISAHFYWGPKAGEDPHYSIAAGPYEAEEYLRVLGGLIEGVRRERKVAHPIHIAVDEWNVWYRARGHQTKLEERYDLSDALVVAAFMNVLRRNCQSIKMANLAQLVNVIAPIFTSKDGLFLQTIYWPLFAAANYSGPVSLDAWVESDGFAASKLLAGSVPYVDVCVTLDEAARKLFVSVVNFSKGEPAEVAIDLGDVVPRGGIEHLVTGPAPDACNDFGSPDVVNLASRPFAVASPRFTHALPPLSAAVLEIAI